ncbi:ATP-grasp domain-containing protein [Evansella tamaricis]|uniref:RimK family alpha-L-glutamate ligase n=1 Tax=Evansella tamaricis TaxID=2069301 RepID=A0ABS6JEX0_9BACI|nr:RimK family alpha-L-glutamate ligase [Evansella tamaricis]MBU9711005.1 RimK family alpha-L-glutamate ligase [Evansella tamaricis]
MNKTYGWIIYNGNLVTDKFMDYVAWFQQVASENNMEVEAIPNNQLIVTLHNRRLSLTGMESKKPDFVHFADKDLHLARQLEALSIPVWNSSRAIELCDNKAAMYHELAQKHLPIPETMIAPKVYEGLPVEDLTHLDLVINQIGFPMIIKEAYGSFGKQVYWVNTEEELKQITQCLNGKEYIFQKPVMTSIGRDIRLNVIGDQVVASMERTSETDFRANVTAGGKTKPYDPTDLEKTLAVSSAKAVGASFAGVDLLFGEDGPILCEVNSNPHLRSIYECTGVDVAVHMINYIHQSLNRMS